MADQDTSFQAMDGILRRAVDIIAADPAVDTVNGFTSGGTNTARMFVSLKPLAERKVTRGHGHRAPASPDWRASRAL